jgi:hypothetical protein
MMKRHGDRSNSALALDALPEKALGNQLLFLYSGVSNEDR